MYWLARPLRWFARRRARFKRQSLSPFSIPLVSPYLNLPLQVTNAYLGPAVMIDSTKAVGIKLYQGGSAHGTALVQNVTWADIEVRNCEYAAQIQSCYGSSDDADCKANPSKSVIEGVYFKRFKGTT
jgi:hypothetical protein